MDGILVNCANSGKFLSELWLIPQDQPVPEEAREVLSPQEQARAARFRFTRDSRRYIARHVALRHILSAYLGQPPASLVFTTGPRGKPELPGLHFSLSDSGDYALCAVSQHGPIGVDIEQQRPLAHLDALARQCLTPAEQAVFQALPEAAPAFFAWWTAKEAALKALGLGLGGGLENIELDWASQSLHSPLSSAPLYLARPAVPPGYAAALITPAPGEVISRLFEWPFINRYESGCPA